LNILLLKNPQKAHNFFTMQFLSVSILLISIAEFQALRINSGFFKSSIKPISSFSLSSAVAPADEKLGWDSHKAVDSIPESLVRTIDGNESLRKRFEVLCRTAQVILLIS
jgi:hypothetical protein